MAALINRVAHICLGVPSLDEAEKFFCGILGLKKHFQFLKNEKVFGFYLDAGNKTYIEIFQGETLPSEKPSIRHLCLETDSIDGVIAKFKAEGYPIGEKKMGADQSYQVWVKGPNGIDIEFHEYTSASCQHTGADCRVNW